MPKENEPKQSMEFFATVKAAGLKTLGFHPFDRAAKLSQNHPKPIINLNQLHGVLLGNHVNSNFPTKVRTLYTGLVPFALAYKTVQMTTLGLLRPTQEKFRGYFSGHNLAADLGSGVGMAGVQTLALQGLNNLKVEKMIGALPQERPQLYKEIFKKISSPRYLVKNSKITFLRNCGFLTTVALTTLPVQNYLVTHKILGNDEKCPSEKQKLVSSVVAAGSALAITAPADVIKTRLQSLSPSAPPINWYQMAKNIYLQEGRSAFTKGIILNSLPELIGFVVFFGLQSLLKKDPGKPANIDKNNSSAFFAKKPKPLPDKLVISPEVLNTQVLGFMLR